MSIKRIRKSPLRHEVEDRLGDARGMTEEKLVAEVLGKAMVDQLDRPEVRLTGYELGDDYDVDAGYPATAFPNDTYPRIFEGLLRRYTEKEDMVGHLFTTSRTPIAIAERLGRSIDGFDDYNSCLPDLCGPLWNSVPQRHLDLLYIHCPVPGVVDRRTLFYPTGPLAFPQGKIHWEGLGKEDFLTKMAALISRWSDMVKPGGVLALQIGWCRWNGEWVLPWPDLHEAVYLHGLRLDTRHRLHMKVRPGPIQNESLTDGRLLIYRKNAADKEVLEIGSIGVRAKGGSE